ncbi:tyrosine-protein phosphatase [Actinomadura sp. 1N219]|uniref:tyrosine-protein phosphatase n=1 Tax=Actinomadura sp. 1N219 TaxID=3375152 RepID=UPI0037B9F0F3
MARTAAMAFRTGCVAVSAVAALGLVQPVAPFAHAASHGNPKISTASAVRAADGSYTLDWPRGRRGQVFVYASTDPRDPSRYGRLVGVTAADQIRVNGLDPARHWFFELGHQRSARTDGLVVGLRHIALTGADNVRDLGGYETASGRAVRWGLVYRSDALAELTDADVTRLASLGLATAVDFRGQEEIDRSGPNRVPSGTSVVNIPLLDEGGNALAAAILKALESGDPGVLEEMLGNGKAVQINLDGYRKMATAEAARKGFRQVLLQLGDNARTPLLYNCTAGKDRTGVMSAVILRLLGVPEKTVIDDYLLSNKYLAADHEQTYAYLASKGIDVELIRPLMEQRAAYIEAFFDGVRSSYGSLEGYLHEGLGLDQRAITNLRRTLLTS